MDADTQLSRRERQTMDIVYVRGEASTTHVLHDMPDPPSRTESRTRPRVPEEKALLRHHREGAR